MIGRRLIITTAALLLVLIASSAALAGANPLLSGYGGPGQGNQAILGSTFINGSSGGGGASGGSSGSVGGENTAPSGPRAGEVAASRTSGGAHGTTRRGGGSVKRTGERSSRGSSAYRSSSGLAATQASVAGSPTLGISGKALLFIILVMGALAVTAAFTARLTYRAR
jgi:hypothetical protein